ncbi:hypothetical protein FRC09_002081 [Ceratobasidium sp. 395]|nr:hypothetical protein FRC09_002081 [Ceratobasidium sp. 395]
MSEANQAPIPDSRGIRTIEFDYDSQPLRGKIVDWCKSLPYQKISRLELHEDTRSSSAAYFLVLVLTDGSIYCLLREAQIDWGDLFGDDAGKTISTNGIQSAEKPTSTEGIQNAEEITSTEGARSVEKATSTEGIQSTEKIASAEGIQSAEIPRVKTFTKVFKTRDVVGKLSSTDSRPSRCLFAATFDPNHTINFLFVLEICHAIQRIPSNLTQRVFASSESFAYAIFAIGVRKSLRERVATTSNAELPSLEPLWNDAYLFVWRRATGFWEKGLTDQTRTIMHRLLRRTAMKTLQSSLEATGSRAGESTNNNTLAAASIIGWLETSINNNEGSQISAWDEAWDTRWEHVWDERWNSELKSIMGQRNITMLLAPAVGHSTFSGLGVTPPVPIANGTASGRAAGRFPVLIKSGTEGVDAPSSNDDSTTQSANVAGVTTKAQRAGRPVDPSIQVDTTRGPAREVPLSPLRISPVNRTMIPYHDGRSICITMSDLAIELGWAAGWEHSIKCSQEEVQSLKATYAAEFAKAQRESVRRARESAQNAPALQAALATALPAPAAPTALTVPAALAAPDAPDAPDAPATPVAPPVTPVGAPAALVDQPPGPTALGEGDTALPESSPEGRFNIFQFVKVKARWKSLIKGGTAKAGHESEPRRSEPQVAPQERQTPTLSRIVPRIRRKLTPGTIKTLNQIPTQQVKHREQLRQNAARNSRLAMKKQLEDCLGRHQVDWIKQADLAWARVQSAKHSPEYGLIKRAEKQWQEVQCPDNFFMSLAPGGLETGVFAEVWEATWKEAWKAAWKSTWESGWEDGIAKGIEFGVAMALGELQTDDNNIPAELASYEKIDHEICTQPSHVKSLSSLRSMYKELEFLYSALSHSVPMPHEHFTLQMWERPEEQSTSLRQKIVDLLQEKPLQPGPLKISHFQFQNEIEKRSEERFKNHEFGQEAFKYGIAEIWEFTMQNQGAEQIEVSEPLESSDETNAQAVRPWYRTSVLF